MEGDDGHDGAYHLAGEELGKFVILAELGRGSMGVVYEVLQTDLKRKVALKILPANIALDAKQVRRFRREAESVARLRHDHIIQIFEVGEIERTHYFSMELVDGRAFGDPPARDRAAVREAARLAMHAAQALQHAHERGVIHRDIKPSNLLVDRTGRVVVTDFGLARLTDSATLTSTDAIVGTPKYMSPEQILPGQSVLDGRTDVYSLGAALYEVISGRPPLEEPTVQAFLRAIIEQRPASPRRYNRDIPHDLATIVLRCLEKDPADRYASAQAMADDLERFLAGDRILAKPKGAVARGYELVRRHKIITALSAIATVALVVTLMVSAWASETSRQATLRTRIAELSRLAQSDLDLAIEKAEALMGEEPTNPEIAIWRADFYQRRARERLERGAEELNCSGARHDFEQAGLAACKWHLQMLIEEGRLAEAQRLAESLPTSGADPEVRLARDLALARIALRQERFADAIELLAPLDGIAGEDPMVPWIAGLAYRELAARAQAADEPTTGDLADRYGLRARESLKRAFDLSLGVREQWLRERVLRDYVASQEGRTVRWTELLPTFEGVARETIDRLADLWLGMTESEAQNVRLYVQRVVKLAGAEDIEPGRLAEIARERLAKATEPADRALSHLLLAVFHLSERLPEVAGSDLAAAEDACFEASRDDLLPYVYWGKSLSDRARGDLEASVDNATMAIEFAGAADAFRDLQPLAEHATLLAEEAHSREQDAAVRDVTGVLERELERTGTPQERVWLGELLSRLRAAAGR